MTTLKERRNVRIRKSLKPMATVMRTWYLDTAMDFLCSRRLSDAEEAFLEDITDFYLKAMDDLKEFSEGDKICPFLQEEMKKDLEQRGQMLYNKNKEQTDDNR